jgi:hypothetical protein
MPEDFALAAWHRAYAAKKGWPAWWLENRFEQFCSLAGSKDWRYADWNLALYTYLRGEIGYRRGPEDLAHLAPKTSESGAEAARRYEARVAAERAAQRARDAAEVDQMGLDLSQDVNALLGAVGNG